MNFVVDQNIKKMMFGLILVGGGIMLSLVFAIAAGWVFLGPIFFGVYLLIRGFIGFSYSSIKRIKG